MIQCLPSKSASTYCFYCHTNHTITLLLRSQKCLPEMLNPATIYHDLVPPDNNEKCYQHYLYIIFYPA